VLTQEATSFHTEAIAEQVEAAMLQTEANVEQMVATTPRSEEPDWLKERVGVHSEAITL
jgi:hypothetical protein